MFAALTNHLWQSTIFAIAAALLALAFRKNRAQVRYWIWLAASLKFLVPFALLIALGTNLWNMLPTQNVAPQIAAPAVAQTMIQIAQPVSDMFSIASTAHHAANWPLISLIAVWACGFFAIALMRLRAWLRIRTALRFSRPIRMSFVAATVARGLCARLSVGAFEYLTQHKQAEPASMTFTGANKNEIRHPEVREADRRTSLALASHALRNDRSTRIRTAPGLLEPGVVGIFRPTLLLPEGILESLTPPQLEAVLAHELAHIRRRDNLTAALHMLVEAIFWFHPFVWWIGARLIDERERACDEAVLSLGNQPRDYAEAILKVCKLYVESPLACAAGVTGANLKRRIHTILAGRLAIELNITKKCALVIAGLITLALPVIVGLINTPSLRAQSEDQTSLSFEVASVKPDPNPSHYFGTHIDISTNYTQYHATGVSAAYLIKDAYALTDDQLSGGPDWINSDKYAIDAKIPEAIGMAWHKKYDRATHEAQMRDMIRSLLADRFQLKVTHETKELPVFALVVAKGGPKISPSNDEAHSGDDGHNEGDIEIEKITARPIDVLLQILTRQPELEGRKVIDQTGLTGAYTYTLKWTQQRPLSTSANDEAQPTSDAPALEDALENQLGLQLKSTKAPIDTVVIDHIEKPSPN